MDLEESYCVLFDGTILIFDYRQQKVRRNVCQGSQWSVRDENRYLKNTSLQRCSMECGFME